MSARGSALPHSVAKQWLCRHPPWVPPCHEPAAICDLGNNLSAWPQRIDRIKSQDSAGNVQALRYH